MFEEFWLKIVMPSELANWTNSQSTTLEERKITPGSSKKTTGSILTILQVLLAVSPSKSRTIGLKSQF